MWISGQESNSGCQSWQQTFLPIEPSHQPSLIFFFFLSAIEVLVMALFDFSKSVYSSPGINLHKQFLPWFLTMGTQSFCSLMGFIAGGRAWQSLLPQMGLGVPIRILRRSHNLLVKATLLRMPCGAAPPAPHPPWQGSEGC